VSPETTESAEQTRVGPPPDPRIEITPTPAQYRQLCHDLAALRGAGAASNTAALLAAVRDAATKLSAV